MAYGDVYEQEIAELKRRLEIYERALHELSEDPPLSSDTCGLIAEKALNIAAQQKDPADYSNCKKDCFVSRLDCPENCPDFELK